MAEIESLSPNGFAQYLDKYSNTICGRHPIGVLLQVCVFVYVCMHVHVCMCLCCVGVHACMFVYM